MDIARVISGAACALALAACGPKSGTTEPVEPAVEPAAAPTPEAEPARPSVVLDGEPVDVRWDDGDTFVTVTAEGERGERARLSGFNTLESYGPVHRWGTWTAADLYGLSKQAGEFASATAWTCTRQEGGGGYGRTKVDCPELRQGLLAEGLAHLFGFDDPPDPADVEIQLQAQRRGSGMWANGVPSVIVTSLHSLDEREDQQETYNRVADTATGMARKVTHAETYAACQEVCVDDACLVYVPFKQRYGDDRAECLR